MCDNVENHAAFILKEKERTRKREGKFKKINKQKYWTESELTPTLITAPVISLNSRLILENPNY